MNGTTHITIEVKHESMVVHNEKLAYARIVWIAAGLTVYVRGPLKGVLYEQARHLALIQCQSMHIPEISLRAYNYAAMKKSSFETKTRRMF